MKTDVLINLAWMQALWFAAVIGAAKGNFFLAPGVLILFMAWTFKQPNRMTDDLKLMLVSVLLGFILDTSWIKLGWLAFASSWPAANIAPVWILMLWAGLALTLNHSMAWLQSHLPLAALLGGLSSPLSYLAATKLGAVKIVSESIDWFIGIGVSWAITLPCLLWLARALKSLGQAEYGHV